MADEEIEDVPKKSKMPLIAAGAVVLLGGGVAGGYFLAPTIDGFLAGDEEEEVALDEDGEPLEEMVEATIITEVGDFTVNLRNSSGGRLLQMEVSVEGPEADATALEERLPAIQDGIVLLVSDFSYEELDGLDGKLNLRDQIQARINNVIAPLNIQRVYFTSFVVQ